MEPLTRSSKSMDFRNHTAVIRHPLHVPEAGVLDMYSGKQSEFPVIRHGLDQSFNIFRSIFFKRIMAVSE